MNVDEIINQFKEIIKIEVRVKKADTLLFYIEAISCSFFKYPYPLLRAVLPLQGTISLASVADIAAMKISAISTRGTKRDFVDLYFVCQKNFTLREVLNFYQKKFGVLNHDLYHVFRSLIYFEDADRDPMPVMFEKANWRKIKSFFNEEVKKLMDSSH